MTLYLLPNVLGPVEEPSLYFSPAVSSAVAQIDGLIAESEGEGRRFLKRFMTKKPTYQMPIALLSKKATSGELDFLLAPVVKGQSWGVVSDCGLPCLADPGAQLVLRARQLNLPVEALAGPSSILLALMLSGLSGQAFYFRGYIPKTEDLRKVALKAWEKESKEQGSTQLFIEAPHRNEQLFASCLSLLHDSTRLCIASHLTLPDQWVKTETIQRWKKIPMETVATHIHKKPTVFLFKTS